MHVLIRLDSGRILTLHMKILYFNLMAYKEGNMT